MGNNESNKFFEGSEVISCLVSIDESDIQAVIRCGVSDADKRVLRGGMTLLPKYSNWVWRDAAIRCIGEDEDYTFCSGSGTNKFVVCYNEYGRVTKDLREAGWRLQLSEAAYSIWGSIRNAVASVTNAAARLAITF